MEDDLETLERALLNLDASESQEKSNHEGLYKNWGKSGSQEERRAQLLEIQKGNRNNKIDRFRGILELVCAVEDDNKLFKPYKKVPYRPNYNVPGFHKSNLSYSNVLMLSEWMIEKPSDLEKNWFVVPCPKGVRLLVIANNGITKFYSKYGTFKFECYTGLPGGNPQNCFRRNCCVLDGFYYEPSNTLYILDLLAWNNQPMTDGETEFRNYWMITQLQDFPDISTINKKNNVIIKTLPMINCSKHYLSHMLSGYPHFKDNSPPLDGLLFYHKKGHYVAGETPLVGWLYPYMIPEVIGKEITMHPGYLAEMPGDYVNQAEFIKKFEAKYAKKNIRLRTFSAMETDRSKVAGQKDKMKDTASAVEESGENEDECNECKSMETDIKDEEQKNGKGKKDKGKSLVKGRNPELMDAEEEKSDFVESLTE